MLEEKRQSWFLRQEKGHKLLKCCQVYSEPRQSALEPLRWSVEYPTPRERERERRI